MGTQCICLKYQIQQKNAYSKLEQLRMNNLFRMLLLLVIITLLCGDSYQCFTTGETTTSKFYENSFDVKLISRFDLLTKHVSRILCSVDLKFVTICFEMKPKSDIADGIFRETLGCVPGASIAIIR